MQKMSENVLTGRVDTHRDAMVAQTLQEMETQQSKTQTEVIPPIAVVLSPTEQLKQKYGLTETTAKPVIGSWDNIAKDAISKLYEGEEERGGFSEDVLKDIVGNSADAIMDFI